ncbi:MAG: nucleotidyl transferase AbiEii/AbiGii toxin family protein [Bacteroidota bacterium]
MLQRETVSGKVLDLIIELQEKTYLKDLFLVGDTGLALQIGHRESVDIDLFTTENFNQEGLLEALEADFGFNLDFIENNTLKGSVEGVKVDILSHKYGMVKPVNTIENIRLASVQDIAAMKVNAISNDGTRVKDFIDIYFLLKGNTIADILTYYSNKYELRNPLHALKSLNYFDDVVTDDWPVIIGEKGLTWKKVMQAIDKACIKFTSKMLD